MWLFSASFPSSFVDSEVSKCSIPDCTVVNLYPTQMKEHTNLLTFIEKYPTVHKTSSPSCLCLMHTSLEMNPLNPSLPFPPSVGKQLPRNGLKPIHTHAHIISVIRSLCISSNLMSVLALKVMNVACGCLRTSGGWRMKDHKCKRRSLARVSGLCTLIS